MRSHFLRANAIPSVTYITSLSSLGQATTFTFSNVATGTGNIVVAVHGERSFVTSISSVTIGGTAATQACQATTNTNTNDSVCGLFYRVVTTDTNTIVVNFTTNGSARCYLGVWRIQGYKSVAPISTATNSSNLNSTGLSTTVTPTPGSIIISATTVNDTVNTDNIIWTNVDENYDIAPDTTRGSGASRRVFSSGNYTVSTSHDAVTQATTLATAVFR